MSTSNIAHVMAWLSDWTDGFNFRRVGKDQTLGRDIAMKVVDRIIERSAGKRSTTEDWPPNSDIPEGKGYASWKEKRYGVADAPNVRTGQMLSQKNLYGRTTIEPKEITMRYGLNEAPDRAKGGELTEADEKVTDVQKAYFAHTGQSKKKVIRKFYEVDASDGAAVIEIVHENISEYVRETNAKSGF